MLQINPNLNYSPGEPRLNFPEPTQAKHPKNTGLRPFTSVNAAISKIPPGHPNHELPPDFKVPRKKYDGNAPLRNIVMTAGTSDTHPSGLRPFSLRELACLQGFPLDHEPPHPSPFNLLILRHSTSSSFAIQPPHPSPFNLLILRHSTSSSFAIQPPYPSLFNLLILRHSTSSSFAIQPYLR